MLAAGGLIEFFASEATYAEYEEVIRRPRLKRDRDVVEGALRTIREKADWVKTTVAVTAASDPDDNTFLELECAQAAEAHYLVTGNIKDFPAVWQTTRIVTAREFMEAFAGARRKPS